MSELIFPILGVTIPPMIGREKLLRRIWSDLTRATASNLSIVGPRFVGKTVLLKALTDLATAGDSPYSLVVYWHLGHPLLFFAVLNQLATGNPGSMIDNETVTAAAKIAAENARGWLDALWDDCHSGAKDAFRLLGEREELSASEVGRDEADCLVTRGLAIRTGNKLKPGCRMMQTHAQCSLPDAGSLKRMFRTWESYRSQIRNVLELRLTQIPVVNNRLHRLVARSIEDIPDFPDDCLNNLTSIEELTLGLIWEHELGASRKVPANVIAYWTVEPRKQDNLVKSMMEADNWKISPEDRLQQVKLLQLLTGSRNGFESRTKRVSKDTYVLINAIHSFRNRNEHPSGQPMHEGVAVAAMVICLELLSCLARDLG